MGFSIGFDSGSGREDDGFFGSLGRSVAAATSPSAEGIGGRARAFLNPGPTLRADEREQQLASVRPVYDQMGNLGQQALRLFAAGKEDEGVFKMQELRDFGLQNGLEPDDKMFDMVDRMIAGMTARKVQNLDPNAPPEQLARGAIGLARTPEQLGSLAGNVQNILTSGAQQKRTEQQTTHEEGKYPLELEGLKKGNALTQEQIETQNTVQAENQAQTERTGVLTAGDRTKNQQEQLEYKSMRDKGYKIPTGPPKTGGVGTEVDDVQAKYNEVQGIIKDVNTGTKGLVPGSTKFFAREQVEPRVGTYNQSVKRFRAIYPDSNMPYLAIDDVPTQQVSDGKGGFVTTGGGVRVRESQEEPGQAPPPGQAPEPARRVPRPPPGNAPESTMPLTPGAAAPARDIMNMNFDERMIPARAQGQVKQLKSELQAALKAARSDQERQQLVVKYGNQIRAAMAAGAQGQ